MSEKTPLELELEHRERYRTSVSVKTFIILLIISICFFGVHTYKLQQDLTRIEEEKIALTSNFEKEKVELLHKIQWLEAKKYSRLERPLMGLTFRDKALFHLLKKKQL